MSSKAAKRRAKKRRKERQVNYLGGTPTQKPQMRTSGPKNGASARPTPERQARGMWATPQGGQKGMQPMVDLASDMIGRLHQEGKLSDAQEQAARDFIGLRAAFMSDLGVTGYRSCLAGGIAGHDEGEGNAETVKAYNAMRDRIGRVKVALLAHETEKLAGERPNSLAALQNALDVFIGD